MVSYRIYIYIWFEYGIIFSIYGVIYTFLTILFPLLLIQPQIFRRSFHLVLQRMVNTTSTPNRNGTQKKMIYLYYCMYCGMPTLNFSRERGMPTVWTWVFCPWMAASRLRGGEEVLKLLQHVGFPNQLTFFQHFGYLLPMFLESLKKNEKNRICVWWSLKHVIG